MYRGLLLALGLSVAALPSQAAVMQAVFEGTFQSGYDARLFFSADLTDLTGMGATFTFVYDTDLGTRRIGADSDSVAGGPDSSDGGVSPIISARVRIDGVERVFQANRWGGVAVLPSDVEFEDWFQAGVSFEEIQGDTRYTGGFSAVLGAPDLPSLLDVSFSAAVGGRNRFGIVNIFGTGGPLDSGVTGFFGPETVVVAPYAEPGVGVAPVPLPATAVLLCFALGVFGTLRSARRCA